MYSAVIRKDRKIWKEIFIRNRIDRGIIQIDNKKYIIVLAVVVEGTDRLIYDLEGEYYE